MQESLRLTQDLKVAQLTARDATGDADQFRDFNELILRHERMYPGIERWLKRKVTPGIVSGERRAYLIYLDNRPVISAVLKNGSDTKICHASIHKELQNRHLGELLFSVLAMDSISQSTRVHFTLPSSLWNQEQEFFRSFGFEDATVAGTQYRLFDQELRCAASMEQFWQRTLEKLPKVMDMFKLEGHEANRGLLMSLKSQYARAIVGGTKRVEIRRRFSKKWIGSTVNIYSSAPNEGLMGQARVEDVICASPDDLWQEYACHIGCSHQQFRTYTAGLSQCYAIRLSDIRPFKQNLGRNTLRHVLKLPVVPPQSYCTLENSKGWSEAVSIASLLNSKLIQAFP